MSVQDQTTFAKALRALAELVTWARYDRAARCFDCEVGGLWIRIQQTVEPAPLPSLPPPPPSSTTVSGEAVEPAPAPVAKTSRPALRLVGASEAA